MFLAIIGFLVLFHGGLAAPITSARCSNGANGFVSGTDADLDDTSSISESIHHRIL